MCQSWSLSQSALTRVIKLSSVTTGLLDDCQHFKSKAIITQLLISVFLPHVENCWLPMCCLHLCLCTWMFTLCVFCIARTKPLCITDAVFSAFQQEHSQTVPVHKRSQKPPRIIDVCAAAAFFFIFFLQQKMLDEQRN